MLKSFSKYIKLVNILNIALYEISNSTLDAAKINRALTLSLPDLFSNLDDLKLTSKSLAENIIIYFIIL